MRNLTFGVSLGNSAEEGDIKIADFGLAARARNTASPSARPAGGAGSVGTVNRDSDLLGTVEYTAGTARGS